MNFNLSIQADSWQEDSKPVFEPEKVFELVFETAVELYFDFEYLKNSPLNTL